MQFKDLAPAEMALASMNGFELAGRSSTFIIFRLPRSQQELTSRPKLNSQSFNSTREE